MNKLKYYFVLLLAGVAIISCSKKDDDDNVVVVPLRDYAEQSKADNESILLYLKSNYITVDPVTFDVTIAKLPADGSKVSIYDQTQYPLQTRDVYSDAITYKAYYLVFNEGVGEAPTNTDNVFFAYNGTLLDGTVFDSSNGLGTNLPLFRYATDRGAVEGVSEILPKFKTGTKNATASDGTVTYSNYGAGMMFLPSGLGYYETVSTTIPAYSPIVFSFKLFDLQRMDHEFTINASTGIRAYVGDGVPDYLEDINKDGYLYDYRTEPTKYPNPPADKIDDTDGDGIPDFVDFDDDGDGYSTRLEITKPTNEVGVVNGFDFGVGKYYPWQPVSDNPATPNTNEFEPRGIPQYSASGDPDYTTPTRLRLHLDKAHHTAKP